MSARTTAKILSVFAVIMLMLAPSASAGFDLDFGGSVSDFFSDFGDSVSDFFSDFGNSVSDFIDFIKPKTDKPADNIKIPDDSHLPDSGKKQTDQGTPDDSGIPITFDPRFVDDVDNDNPPGHDPDTIPGVPPNDETPVVNPPFPPDDDTPVPNVPPVAVLSASPLNGEAPLWVLFDGSQSYDFGSGRIVMYSWDFGDGTTFAGAEASVVQHRFENAGTYTAKLRVTDNDGASTTASVTIVVTQKQEPPVPNVPPVEQEPELGIHISSIRLPDDSRAGSTVPVILSFRNNGDKKLENIEATIVIQELGLRDNVGPFTLGVGKTLTKKLYLELPNDITPGDYDVRITIHSTPVKRVVHRTVSVVTT